MRPGEPPGQAPSAPQRVTWTHALSRVDLMRLLPRLVAPLSLVRAGDCLCGTLPDGRRLTIELGPETERRLGSLRLRDTTFTFVFEGWTEAQTGAFLVRCTHGLQQGGG